MHGQDALRHGRNRDCQFSFAAVSIGVDAHLQGTELHQPKAAGEKLRIVLGLLRHVRSGRVLRARSGELHRRDANFANAGRFAADIDLRDAGNHLRHAHGDEEAIGSGVAFEENVGAANVRRSRRRQQEHRAENA